MHLTNHTKFEPGQITNTHTHTLETQGFEFLQLSDAAVTMNNTVKVKESGMKG